MAATARYSICEESSWEIRCHQGTMKDYRNILLKESDILVTCCCIREFPVATKSKERAHRNQIQTKPNENSLHSIIPASTSRNSSQASVGAPSISSSNGSKCFSWLGCKVVFCESSMCAVVDAVDGAVDSASAS